MSILENINSRDDLLRLDSTQLDQLCSEIRAFLIEHVSQTGGHLASNLGIVEATVAVHRVFDTAADRLVFDVGHQSYVHKLLTGRRESFATLRSFGGISGFPKPEESIHDAFIAGHASNSVSVALGMARARTDRKQTHNVVALIGDGALTGGLAYEGLNDAGASREPLIVILNDNAMSITKNVGGISKHLALLRLKPGYFGFKKAYRKLTSSVPGGKWIYSLTHKIKSFLKRSLIGTTVFEEMGLTYLGPVDGHDVGKVEYLLRVAKELGVPVLVHIITQKGRGYAPAEMEPQNYHGVGHFDPDVGIVSPGGNKAFSDVFGDALVHLAENDDKICAVTAAMRQGTGLDSFAVQFPDRFYDVGIAEGHAVSMAAGMAAAGSVPVVALYSTFLQRAYDMLLHDVALMQNHVVFAVDRCGLVGQDGPTHHGVFDVGYLRQIPGMTIFAPATAEEVQSMLHEAVYTCKGPVAIRYPRGYCCSSKELSFQNDENAAVTLITYGIMTAHACDAAHILREQGIGVQVIRLTCLNPLDLTEIIQSVSKTGCGVIVEDCVSNGCVGQDIIAKISETGIHCKWKLLNLRDDFTPHGTTKELLSFAELDASSIAKKTREVLGYET